MTKPPPDGILYEDCDTYITGTGQRLVNIHPRVACAPTACVIHNPSDHAMRSFPTLFRDDRGFMERICPHGIGHPDPDDPYADPVHGCDGCCGISLTPDIEVEVTTQVDESTYWQLLGYDHKPTRWRLFLERIGLVKRP